MAAISLCVFQVRFSFVKRNAFSFGSAVENGQSVSPGVLVLITRKTTRYYGVIASILVLYVGGPRFESTAQDRIF
jgi:hypothetical protein